MDELPPKGELLRFVYPAPAFIGDDGGHPTWRAMKPNNGDCEEATTGRHPIRISVFDLASCSVNQARAYCEKPDKPKSGAWKLAVRNVAEARQRWKMNEMRVVRAPIRPLTAGHDVAMEAHSGIEGLEQRGDLNEPTPRWKAGLGDLSNALEPA